MSVCPFMKKEKGVAKKVLQIKEKRKNAIIEKCHYRQKVNQMIEKVNLMIEKVNLHQKSQFILKKLIKFDSFLI